MAQYINITYDMVAKHLVNDDDGEVIGNMKDCIWPSELEKSVRVSISIADCRITFNNRTFLNKWTLCFTTHHRSLSLFNHGRRILRYVWPLTTRTPVNLQELWDMMMTIPLIKENIEKVFAMKGAPQENSESKSDIEEIKQRIARLQEEVTRLGGSPVTA